MADFNVNSHRNLRLFTDRLGLINTKFVNTHPECGQSLFIEPNKCLSIPSE